MDTVQERRRRFAQASAYLNDYELGALAFGAGLRVPRVGEGDGPGQAQIRALVDLGLTVAEGRLMVEDGLAAAADRREELLDLRRLTPTLAGMEVGRRLAELGARVRRTAAGAVEE